MDLGKSPLVLDNGSWDIDKGLLVGEITDSKPLTEEEAEVFVSESKP